MPEVLIDRGRVAARDQLCILSASNGHGEYKSISAEEMDWYMRQFRLSGADSLPGVAIDIPINEAKVLAGEERYLRKRLLRTLRDVMAARRVNPEREDIQNGAITQEEEMVGIQRHLSQGVGPLDEHRLLEGEE